MIDSKAEMWVKPMAWPNSWTATANRSIPWASEKKVIVNIKTALRANHTLGGEGHSGVYVNMHICGAVRERGRMEQETKRL